MSDEPTWDPDRPTQVTCPSCDACGGWRQERCAVCRGVGVVDVETMRAWRTAHPDGQLVPCPACKGEGMVIEEVGTGHRGRVCKCCNGSSRVALSRSREWRIAHVIGRFDDGGDE